MTKTKPMPDNAVTYILDKDTHTIAVCVPADGFEKLIMYEKSGRSWVHKNFKIERKKSRKKGKKRLDKRS